MGGLGPVSSLPRLEAQRYRPLPSWIDMNRSRCRNVLLGDIGDSGNVKTVTTAGRAGPGVCAAASPGSGGQRREAFSSAEEQVGDPIAKIKTPG
jgi:hypothetical protein